MATTSFTIYSRYDPENDKERLQRETGQTSNGNETKELDSELQWKEAASAKFLRIQRPAPKFVPAAISHEIGGQTGFSKTRISSQEAASGSSLSSWYRSLTTTDPAEVATYLRRPSSAPLPTPPVRPDQGAKKPSQTRGTRDKNNWFIQKVLRSEVPSAPSTPLPTLADILAREPPPLPSEPKYTPPVWIEIGPSNKGFAMLQKSGWNEGEALGLGVKRRPPSSASPEGPTTTDKGKRKAVMAEAKKNRTSRITTRELCDNAGDVKEEVVGLIDLTLSDSEDEAFERKGKETGDSKPELFYELSDTSDHMSIDSEDTEDISAHGRKALLVPIATVLKLDRLGIGLKAKTEGPYKASVKRVTHSAASLAAHRRAAEEARRRREFFGRGRRGYERLKRIEEDKRRNLLAYMNT